MICVDLCGSVLAVLIFEVLLVCQLNPQRKRVTQYVGLGAQPWGLKLSIMGPILWYPALGIPLNISIMGGINISIMT